VRLCTGRTAHRGSRDIALLFLDNGTRRGWGVSVTPRPLFTPGKDPVTILQEVGWAPGPVWTGAENLAPTGIRFPDRSARSQSLYRLRYPAHEVIVKVKEKYFKAPYRPACMLLNVNVVVSVQFKLHFSFWNNKTCPSIIVNFYTVLR
jgi:hypothetical protein